MRRDLLVIATLVAMGAASARCSADAPRLAVIAAGPGAGHHLAYGAKPLLLIGDSVTQGWVESGLDFNQNAYVEALGRRGITALLLWAFIGPQQGDDDRLGYDAPDLLPWVSTGVTTWDLTRLNDAYFERLAALCRSAREAGIVVIVQPFDGWTKTRFSTHPFNQTNGGPLMDRAQFVELADYDHELPVAYNPRWTWRQRNQYFQERFFARIIEATSAYGNVCYELFNEGEWYDRTQRRLHEIHFLAFASARCANVLMTNADHIGGVDFRTDPRVGVISYHRPNWTCATGAAASFDHYRAAFAGSPAKPFFFSEPVPEFDAADASEVEAMMRLMWGTALAGAGFVVQNDASFGFNPRARITSRATLRDAMLDREGACARFFNRLGVEWIHMVPAPALSSTGIAYARVGVEYVVYSQEGATLTVDLSADATATFEARFYNPRTGAIGDARRVKGGKAQEPFTKPDARDWVLWIRRAAE